MNKYEAQTLKNIEIDMEIRKCVPNSSIISIFKYAKSANKRIFIISDMYLSKLVIEKMLSKCNVSGYEKLYVSCECNCNKLSGKLFEYVLQKNNLNHREIVHFGDSIRADFLGAFKSHVRCHLIYRDNRFRKIWCRIVGK